MGILFEIWMDNLFKGHRIEINDLFLVRAQTGRGYYGIFNGSPGLASVESRQVYPHKYLRNDIAFNFEKKSKS